MKNWQYNLRDFFAFISDLNQQRSSWLGLLDSNLLSSYPEEYSFFFIDMQIENYIYNEKSWEITGLPEELRLEVLSFAEAYKDFNNKISTWFQLKDVHEKIIDDIDWKVIATKSRIIHQKLVQLL